MTSRTRSAGAWLCLLSLSPLLGGCGASSGGYDSPEAVAAAAKAAIDKKDMGAFYDCLTEESQNTLTGSAVLVGSMMKLRASMAAMDGPEAQADAEKETAEVTTIMEKHGVTEESLKDANPNPAMMGDSQAIGALANVVKDKRAFVHEVFTALDKMKQGGPDLSQQFTGELKDLKVDGDKATAKLTTQRGEEELDFRKTAAGWKLHIDMEKMGPRSTGAPPMVDATEIPAADPFAPPATEEDAELEVDSESEK
ncbi:MAG: hypothetical protein H0T51_26600 [Pirellulales bacterium]|nr:hypothetical protein [Pirellulales bacterium]